MNMKKKSNLDHISISIGDLFKQSHSTSLYLCVGMHLSILGEKIVQIEFYSRDNNRYYQAAYSYNMLKAFIHDGTWIQYAVNKYE